MFFKFNTSFVIIAVNMPRNTYKTAVPNKPAVDINALVAAVKEVTIEKKALRAVGISYNIDKSKLSRYISKLKAENLDPTTASDGKSRP